MAKSNSHHFAAKMLAGTDIEGAQLRPLTMNFDKRGYFTEIFRDTWQLPIEPVQWNMVSSRPRVLRGMHLHFRHDEYISVVRGRGCVGLYDFRTNSPTAGASALYELNGEELCCLSFPRGILHGWYFYEESLHLQGVSENYDEYHREDNMGCLWSDPDLNIPWPDASPIVSERAANFPSLAELSAKCGRTSPPAR